MHTEDIFALGLGLQLPWKLKAQLTQLIRPSYSLPLTHTLKNPLQLLAPKTEHIPRPSHPMLLPSHQIFDVQPTRKRLEYASPLPPLELDYSFGMDAGRTSFVEQLRIVKSRKSQTT